ncbi:hypothetical protein, partial [Lactiplantibacillus mudanjiangensis]|uniref:hypothetical protein n=1 Tax=Lactiplantibacillus mudanjiangensis TaxID=1296538 RepID=UPI0013EEF648
ILDDIAARNNVIGDPILTSGSDVLDEAVRNLASAFPGLVIAVMDIEDIVEEPLDTGIPSQVAIRIADRFYDMDWKPGTSNPHHLGFVAESLRASIGPESAQPMGYEEETLSYAMG